MSQQGSRWSLVEDILLWKCRTKSVETLAKSFGRTNAGISYRLQGLRDKKHAAHQRLCLYHGKEIGQKHIRCNISHQQISPLEHLLNTITTDKQYDPHTANRGKSWRVEDNNCIKRNMDCSYQELAVHHQRTVGAIRKRVELLTDMNDNPMTSIFEKRAQRNRTNHNTYSNPNDTTKCLKTQNRTHRKRPRHFDDDEKYEEPPRKRHKTKEERRRSELREQIKRQKQDKFRKKKRDSTVRFPQILVREKYLCREVCYTSRSCKAARAKT
eukprot:496588_1